MDTGKEIKRCIDNLLTIIYGRDCKENKCEINKDKGGDFLSLNITYKIESNNHDPANIILFKNKLVDINFSHYSDMEFTLDIKSDFPYKELYIFVIDRSKIELDKINKKSINKEKTPKKEEINTNRPIALKLQKYIFDNFGNDVIITKNTFTITTGPSIIKDMEMIIKNLPRDVNIQKLKETKFIELFPYGLKVNYNVFKNILTITAQETGIDV